MATATTASTTAFLLGVEKANAAIDVSGLAIEEGNGGTAQSTSQSSTSLQSQPGRPPNTPKSGPLAGTKLGFQVGGGPRSEEVVRAIDAPRYAAVRKAQGKGPLFLEGVPIEQKKN